MNVHRRQFLRRGLILGSLILAAALFSADEPKEVKIDFDMPEGKAVRTLRKAARQGGVDIVFSAETVEGVRTRALKGNYTPSRAFTLMLYGSPLIAVKHRESGIYLIKKRSVPVQKNR